MSSPKVVATADSDFAAKKFSNYVLSAVQANYIHCTHWSYLCLNFSRGNIEEDKDTHQMGRVGVSREISLWRRQSKIQFEA